MLKSITIVHSLLLDKNRNHLWCKLSATWCSFLSENNCEMRFAKN